MPESAIASGCIDFVLSPEDIAQRLVQIARRGIERQRLGSVRRHNT
jgi:chemotaxis response regulator CheB